MKCNMARQCVGLMCIFGILSSAGLADRRSYVWTYEYQTMPKGTAEIEYYLTHKISDWDNYDDKNTWEHAVELEYGITDHWDVAIYQTWQQTNTDTDDSFDYTGSKLRTRYRIGEKGQLPVDVLLYAEYIFGQGPKEYDKFEGKLILARILESGIFHITRSMNKRQKTVMTLSMATQPASVTSSRRHGRPELSLPVTIPRANIMWAQPYPGPLKNYGSIWVSLGVSVTEAMTFSSDYWLVFRSKI